jgi:cation diffusion facilitator CzcD-associated flavoprotein CzcO
MFLAIKADKASIVTATIDAFTEKGIKLTSGKELEADIIITATGLNLQMFGGAELNVDGKKIETGKLYAYKGAMYSEVPNFASVFGYTNASWTLRADLICQYVCRLVNYLSDYGLGQVTPRLRGSHTDKPFVDFSSGYFQRVRDILPKQTTMAPWRQNQSYAHDLMDLKFGALEDGVLEFKRAPERQAAALEHGAPALA